MSADAGRNDTCNEDAAQADAGKADAGTGDVGALRAATLAWVAGWHTSPDRPFDIAAVAEFYAQDEFSSFDFGRPHDGFADWDRAAAYYQKFMAVPRTWQLTPVGTPRVTVRGDVAWTTLPLTGRGTLADGTVIDMPEARVTLIFERRGDTWLIVHEHGSSALPFPDGDAVSQMLRQ